MRRNDPLILGAGPAGTAAAIALARGGARPVLVDRDAEPGDPLCGGFLSWRTAERLRGLGVDCAALGAQPVHRLRLLSGGRQAEMPLPARAFGLSRHALDTALRARAVAAGARVEVDRIRQVDGLTASGATREWEAGSLFLASGKHDIRGERRPRGGDDPWLGLRLRLPPSPSRSALIGDAIELHLFPGGYAGIVLQEGGSANVCAALRKSALAQADGDAVTLLDGLARANPLLAERFGPDWRSARIESIGAVPYGWIARETRPGLFRLGDQAAVIPSLAGEGIAIALASGIAAGEAWLAGGAAAAPAFQRRFARAAGRPVRAAGLARMAAESPAGSRLALALAGHAGPVLRWLMDATRIEGPASLARATSAP